MLNKKENATREGINVVSVVVDYRREYRIKKKKGENIEKDTINAFTPFDIYIYIHIYIYKKKKSFESSQNLFFGNRGTTKQKNYKRNDRKER